MYLVQVQQMKILISKPMKDNYLYIISKQEFTSLIRFGSIPYHDNLLLENNDSNRNVLEEEIISAFKRVAPFVGDEEYLILSIHNFPEENLRMVDLSEIIPLTQAAKVGYEQKFDSRINFGLPKYESIIKKVEIEIDFDQKVQGAKAIQSIFKLSDNSFHVYLKEIKNGFLKRLQGSRSDGFQGSFWEHLYVYDRYELFPKTDLGYLYDLGEIFAHSKGKKSFVNSGYYKFLEANKDELREKSLSKLIERFTSEESIDGIRTPLIEEGFKKYVVALLYLLFKNQLSETEQLNDTSIPKTVEWILKNKKEYINELSASLFLLGAFFGYERFYDDLYGSMNIQVFESSLSIHGIQEVSPENDIHLKEVSQTEDQQKEELSTEIIEQEVTKEGNEIEKTDTLSDEADGVFDAIINLFGDREEFTIAKVDLQELKKILKSSFGKEPKKDEITHFIMTNYKGKFLVEKNKLKVVKKTPLGL